MAPALGVQNSCEDIFQGLKSHSDGQIVSPKFFEYLRPFYQSYRTLTLVSNPEDAIHVSKLLMSNHPNQKVLRLPEVTFDLYWTRMTTLEKYNHLVATEVAPTDAFVKGIPLIVDLRQDRSEDITKKLLSQLSAMFPSPESYSVLAVNELQQIVWLHSKNQTMNTQRWFEQDSSIFLDPSERVTKNLVRQIGPNGKEDLPRAIDYLFYEKLNKYFLERLHEEDILNIFPKSDDGTGLYSKFYQLRQNYPFGWWRPLSPKVIEFLDQRNLKGPFQVAVDIYRGQQLSAYIIEHQNDKYYLISKGKKNDLSIWFTKIGQRNPKVDWRDFLSEEARRIVEHREKLAQQRTAEKKELEQTKKTLEDIAEVQRQLYKQLSKYILSHKDETDNAMLFPQPADYFELRRWTRDQIRKKPTQWIYGLSPKAQEVLKNRGLSQIKTIPHLTPGVKPKKGK